MGALLEWDRDDHFAVDHGLSGISRKTIRFYAGQADIGFAAYPVGELLCRFLNYDTTGLHRLLKLRGERRPVSPGETAGLLTGMPYYEALMAQLIPERESACAQQFSQYQRGVLWQDAADCFYLIENRYKYIADLLCSRGSQELPRPLAAALQSGALDSPALGEPLRTPVPVPSVRYTAAGTRQEPVFSEEYRAGKLVELAYLDLLHLLRAGGSLQKCSNCGGYFVPEKGYAYRYCARVLPGAAVTCREIGAAQARKAKVAADGILSEYQRAYKRCYARVLKQRWSREQFTAWQQQAAALRDRALAENWQPARFLEKLKDVP